MKKKLHYETPYDYLKAIWNKVSATDKFAFFCGFAVCIAVNLFVYTNTCFVHDSIQMFNESTGLENGRLLVGPLMSLFNKMQLPWLIGLFSSLIMGIIIVYLAKIYHVTNKLYIVLLAGIVVTSDTIVVSHAYFGSLHIFFLSLLFAVMAVYYSDVKKYGYIISVLLLCISIFMYQAYLATAICLFIFKLIYNVLKKEDTVKANLLLIAKYASISIISVGVYYLIWQLVLKLCKTDMSGYYAYSGLEKGFSISDVIINFGYSCASTVQQIAGITLYGFYGFCTISIILSALCAVLLIVAKKSLVNKLFIAVYIIAYLYSANIMYLLSGSVVYALTVFATVLPLITLLFILDDKEIMDRIKGRAVISWTSSLLCAVLILGQAVYANSTYLKMKVNYDNAWSLATRIVDRIEQTEGFNENTNVVLLGPLGRMTKYDYNMDIYKRVSYPFKSNLKFSYPIYNNGVTYPLILEWFIEQEMDMDISIEVCPERYKDFQIGVFPSSDSIKWNGNDLVVGVSIARNFEDEERLYEQPLKQTGIEQ